MKFYFVYRFECYQYKKPKMKFTKLVPNIFYTDITIGLKLFTECLEFSIGHNELNAHQPFCVIEKDGLRINLFQDKEYAEKDRIGRASCRERENRGRDSDAGEVK